MAGSREAAEYNAEQISEFFRRVFLRAGVYPQRAKCYSQN